MKLFYDNLISFMPNSVMVDGKAIPDRKLDAARKAMIMLADFQTTRNVSSLYESVHQISIYADIDIVDLILSLTDIEVDVGKLDDLLDIAAKNLFKTVTDAKSFDYKYYSAILLSVAHTVWTIQQQAVQLERISENNTDKGEDTAQ